MLQSKITNRTAKSSIHLGRPWLVSRDVEIDLLGPSEMLFTKQRLSHVTRKAYDVSWSQCKKLREKPC